MVQKRKLPLWFLFAGAFVSVYLGYLLNGAWSNGKTINAFMQNINGVLVRPFADYWNVTSWKAMILLFAIYVVLVLTYLSNQKKYMPGKEYGTSEFADIKAVNKKLEDKNPSQNRVLSQNVRLSLDTRKTRLNLNQLIIGGSGAGKSFFSALVNLMMLNTSFLITDPKGELLRNTGGMLKRCGYQVKVLNLLSMEQSDCYNPFNYVRQDTDIIKLITNLMANTTPNNAQSNDPFWEKAESLYLQSLFYYVWMEFPKEQRNFESVLKLLGEAEVRSDGKPSELDKRMKALERNKGGIHPAVKQYNKVVRGAGDTVRSIIISANSRLGLLESPQVLRLLSRDEMEIEQLGIGVNGDIKTKTALFCVLPDSDKSYNFIVGLLYSQIFQELFYQADFKFGGRLPIHVTMLLDEFANVALPDNFCGALSVMRSREISCMMYIQNIAQIKALFKDTWETIPGNSDVLVYLGGNESSSHEYISKLTDKITLDKKSSGETKGKNGSSSRNYDVLGRELMTSGEVRKLDNRKCLIFIRGFNPIIDEKFNTFNHPMFRHCVSGGAEAYDHQKSKKNATKPSFTVLNKEAITHYEKEKVEGKNVFLHTMNVEEVLSLDLSEPFVENRIFAKEELEKNRADGGKVKGNKKAVGHCNSDKTEVLGNKAIPQPVTEEKAKIELENRLVTCEFNENQLHEVEMGLNHGLTCHQVLSYVKVKNSGNTMREMRMALEQKKESTRSDTNN